MLFLSVLASASPDALKSYDLTWLLHLVGDIHQPLHAATRVTAAQFYGDNGGNSVRICQDTLCNATTNLHSVWDGVLSSQVDVASAIAAARQLPTARGVACGAHSTRRSGCRKAWRSRNPTSIRCRFAWASGHAPSPALTACTRGRSGAAQIALAGDPSGGSVEPRSGGVEHPWHSLSGSANLTYHCARSGLPTRQPSSCETL